MYVCKCWPRCMVQFTVSKMYKRVLRHLVFNLYRAVQKKYFPERPSRRNRSVQLQHSPLLDTETGQISSDLDLPPTQIDDLF